MKINGRYGSYSPVFEEKVDHTIDDVDSNKEKTPFIIAFDGAIGESAQVRFLNPKGEEETISNFTGQFMQAAIKVYATGTDANKILLKR